MVAGDVVAQGRKKDVLGIAVTFAAADARVVRYKFFGLRVIAFDDEHMPFGAGLGEEGIVEFLAVDGDDDGIVSHQFKNEVFKRVDRFDLRVLIVKKPFENQVHRVLGGSVAKFAGLGFFKSGDGSDLGEGFFF